MRSSIDGERGRQRAGAQQDGEIVRRLDGEIAGDLAAPAEDRLADVRRGDHLVVEHDGERLADILPASPRRICARPLELKRKLTIGWLLRWSKPGCASMRSAPETSTRFSIEIFLAALAVEDFRVLPADATPRLLRGHRLIDHAEIELCRLAENRLQPRRVLQTRHLNENTVDALALDGGFDEAEFVDAPLDDLDRLIDRLADRVR